MTNLDNMTAVQVIQGGVVIDITQVNVIKGGVTSTVWRKATPYTINTFNKDEWTFSEPNGGGEYSYGVTTNEAVNGLWIEATKTAGNYAYGRLSKALPTQGCNKLRAKVGITSSNGSGWVDVYGITHSGDAFYGKDFYFDISGENIDFYFQAQSGEDGVTSRVTLIELEFYYE